MRSEGSQATPRRRRATRAPAPVPIANLTKKSRGRRVPTSPILVQDGGIKKSARPHICPAEDCGKRFGRSEHLKRHVRSIHTEEKPHECPVPDCGKTFSRHDNLNQHLRVHKGYKRS
ncbi:hypothetical protein PENSPDRAFT_588778 [Peniophora sp. CONT]|nr:hypothetical protein PENSPDRAFT_588778 [Peniophora sp. CONT]